MSDCPEPIRQLVLLNGVEKTVNHILSHVREQKDRASKACCSYDADEKDYHDLSQATKHEKVLSKACDELCK